MRCGLSVLQYDVAEEQHRLKRTGRVTPGNCPDSTMMHRAMIVGKCGLPVLHHVTYAEAAAPA